MVSTALRVKELLRERGWTTKVLAEKTGMSESYLTHIKNGTRRWNEDALKKLAVAFEKHPTELFSQHRPQFKEVDSSVTLAASEPVDLSVRVIPVVGEIPSHPSSYNNQLMQVTTGYKDVFVPVFDHADESLFCLCIDNNQYAPKFVKGDMLVISPETWTKSGDIAAVEYGKNDPVRTVVQVNYMDDFIVLESLNHKNAPIALVRGKDTFRVIGKVLYRYQKLS